MVTQHAQTTYEQNRRKGCTALVRDLRHNAGNDMSFISNVPAQTTFHYVQTRKTQFRPSACVPRAERWAPLKTMV